MKRFVILIPLIVFLYVQFASAQMDMQLDRDLDRLQALLNRVRTLSSVIQNSDLRTQFNQLIQEIELELRTARQFARNHKWELARAHLRAAFQKLNLLERRLRNLPGIRIRFKEEADRKIHQAELTLRDNRNDQAVRMLERARFFRNKAFQLARNDNPFAALEYYRMAIFFADKAIQLAGPAGRDHTPDLKALWDEVELLYRRAELLARRSSDPKLTQLFAAATLSYRKIRRLIDAHKWSQAVQQSRALAHLLYRILDMGERIPEAEDFRLTENIQRLEGQLNNLESDPQLTQGTQTRALLDKARRFLARAKQLLAQNHLQLARQKLLLANRLVVKLKQLHSLSQKDPETRVRDEIARTRATLQALNGKAQEAGFMEFRKLIEENLKQAEGFARQHQYTQALQTLKVAKVMMLKLNHLAVLQESQTVEALGARAVIERLEQLIHRLESKSQTASVEAFKLENAHRLLELARQAGATNRWALANQYAQLGISILTR